MICGESFPFPHMVFAFPHGRWSDGSLLNLWAWGVLEGLWEFNSASPLEQLGWFGERPGAKKAVHWLVFRLLLTETE